jgi:DNA helicase HerA-like ATPase
MVDPLLIAKVGDAPLYLLPQMANRHGLVAGATGTGKTVTLQVMAEAFSRIGVPVFAADIKGDLSGISQPATDNPKIADRVKKLKLSDFSFSACPVTCWDVFGEQGHPIRATISEMGPLLLGRLLNLNDTQDGVLNLVFKIADDNQLLLLDLKDLQSMLQYVGDHAKDFQTQYGNISAASIGAIQRGLLALQQQGAEKFFGEPALNLRATASSTFLPQISSTNRPKSTPRFFFGCSLHSSNICLKSAIPKNPNWFSSLTKPTCCSAIFQKLLRTKSSRLSA